MCGLPSVGKKFSRHAIRTDVCVCFSIITITSMRVFDMSICICDLREVVCGHGVRHEFEWQLPKALNTSI